MLGIGVFSPSSPPSYLELVKEMATDRHLYLIIAGSDYIYGTNYQFSHLYFGKDLHHVTRAKMIQGMGRVGRGKCQQKYTIRLRDDRLAATLFGAGHKSIERENMCRLLV